jgi:hypothetical protein
MTPTVLRGLPVHFQGVDDTTPPGCTIFTTTLLDLLTTYILRDDVIIGRVEHTQDMPGYAGRGLKGGSLVGFGDFTELAARIAARATAGSSEAGRA